MERTRRSLIFTGLIAIVMTLFAFAFGFGLLNKNLTNENVYADDTYTLTFDANGGTIAAGEDWTGSGSSVIKTVTYGQPYGNLPVADKEGYVFAGWELSEISQLDNIVYGKLLVASKDSDQVTTIDSETGAYLGSKIYFSEGAGVVQFKYKCTTVNMYVDIYAFDSTDTCIHVAEYTWGKSSGTKTKSINYKPTEATEPLPQEDLSKISYIRMNFRPKTTGGTVNNAITLLTYNLRQIDPRYAITISSTDLAPAANQSFRAAYTRDEYTVIFDANGMDINETLPTNVKVYYNGRMEAENWPVLTAVNKGATFARTQDSSGWSPDPNTTKASDTLDLQTQFTELQLQKSDETLHPFDFENKTVTLYAVWIEHNLEVTVKKEADVWSDTDVRIALYVDGVVKYDYNYEHLNKVGGVYDFRQIEIYDENSNPIQYQVYAQHSTSDLTMVYTGKTQAPEYSGGMQRNQTNFHYNTVTLVAGSNISSVEGGGIYVSGSSATITATPTTGSTFTKWTKGTTSTVVSTENPYTFAVPSSAVTYKANAQAAAKIYVHFNNNGGQGTIADQEVVYGGSIDLPECTFTAPQGKQFKCWVDNLQNPSAHEYAEGETYSTIISDVTIYAVWEDIPQEPTLTGLTASYTGGNIVVGNKINGAKIELTLTYDDESTESLSPLASGVSYWYQGQQIQDPVNYVFDTVGQLTIEVRYQSLSANMTVNVVAAPAEPQSISATYAGTIFVGDCLNGQLLTVTLTYSDESTEALDLLTEVKYYDGETLIENPQEFVFNQAGVKTITVKYAQDESITCDLQINVSSGYTVTFRANGGTGTMSTVENIHGDYVLPANEFTAPQGMKFKCWTVAGQEKQVGATIQVNANTFVDAVWTEKVAELSLTAQQASQGYDAKALFSQAKADGDKVLIKVADAKVKFDNAAVNAIGSSDTVTFAMTISDDLSDVTVKGAVKVINISINGFNAGKSTLEVPFSTAELLGNKIVKVYYVDDQDNKIDMEATVENGVAKFNTTHFSKYVIAIEGKDEPSGSFPVWAIAIIVLAGLLIVGFVVYKVIAGKKMSNKIYK